MNSLRLDATGLAATVGPDGSVDALPLCPDTTDEHVAIECVVASLFEDAERHAADGLFERARRTLAQIVVFEPEHGPAFLLKARLDVACQQWTDALRSIEQARRCGVDVPSELLSTASRHCSG